MRGFSFRGSQVVISWELWTRLTCLLLFPFCFTEPVTKDPKSATKSRKTPSHIFPLLKGTWLSLLDPRRTMKHSELLVLFMYFHKGCVISRTPSASHRYCVINLLSLEPSNPVTVVTSWSSTGPRGWWLYQHRRPPNLRKPLRNLIW